MNNIGNHLSNPSSLSLHHVAIRARDFDAAMRFYVEGLGFVVRHTFAIPSAGIRRCAFLGTGDGTTYIELFDRGESLGSEKSPPEVLLHFALRVKSVNDYYERALAAGAHSQMPPKKVGVGEPPIELSFALVLGPSGETIEFFSSPGL